MPKQLPSRPRVRYGGTFMAALLVISAPPAIAHPAGSAPKITAEVLDCGRILPSTTVATTEELQTVSGHVQVMDAYETPQFTGACDRLKVWNGAEFGIWVKAVGRPYGSTIPLKTRVTHPPITNPNTGNTQAVDEWDSPMDSGKPRFAGWVFEEPWELVPGVWKIEILSGDSIVASTDFLIEEGVKPGDESDTPAVSQLPSHICLTLRDPPFHAKRHQARGR